MNESQVPPAPGAPPPGTGGPKIPWEDRKRFGALNAFFETVKLFVGSPQRAFDQTPRLGDYISPLLFAVVMGCLGTIASQLWSLATGPALLRLLPVPAERFSHLFATSAVGAIIAVVLAPILVPIGLFILAAILHLCLMLVGGLKESQAGFEGTFRAVSYASVAQLANVVPLVGGLIVLVWAIILDVIGLTTLHRTSRGKATLAVLLPVAVCCVCVALAIALGVTAFLARSAAR